MTFCKPRSRGGKGGDTGFCYHDNGKRVRCAGRIYIVRENLVLRWDVEGISRGWGILRRREQVRETEQEALLFTGIEKYNSPFKRQGNCTSLLVTLI
jgi:hypothetical protein